MANYLDKDGLLYFWQKIKNVFAQKTEIPSNTSDLTNDSNFPVDANYVHTDNNYTTAEKNKLSGIAAGAEVNQNAFSKITVDTSSGGAASAENIQADSKTDTLKLNQGSNIQFTANVNEDSITISATDTTYSDATTSASGLMSSTDKTKLDGIAAGAQVNQDAYSYVKVKVGSTTTSIPAASATDQVTFVQGNNVTLTPDASSKTVTIAATDTTYVDATTSVSGLMSAADKTKLDGIETGAEVNTVTDVQVSGTSVLSSGVANIPEQSYDSTNQTSVKGVVDGLLIAQLQGNPTILAETSTAAATATKTLGYSGGAQLTVGSSPDLGTILILKSQYTNSASSPKFQFGSHTAYDVKYNGSAATAGYAGHASRICLYVFYSNAWHWIGWSYETNTTYSNATTSAAGLMSAADKTKLNGIAEGAEVNQNAFSVVSVDGQDVSSISATDTLELIAGTNVSIVPTSSSSARSIRINATDTTYSNATQSAAGLMSSTDKTKLDGFSAASNYALKSDITGMYKYKGSVATASGLPSSGQTTGDVYNIEAASVYGGAGMNVAWNGSAWDPLGEIFSITSVTNAEIDTIVAS